MKKLVIISLILGIFGLLLACEEVVMLLLFLVSGKTVVKIIICLAAVIFGILPIIKRVRRALAIVGLVLGVVGIFIVYMDWFNEHKVKKEGIFLTGREWTYKADFINSEGDTVDSQKVSLKVPGGRFFGQTKIEWFFSKTGEKEITGVVEDISRVWIHPPRQGDFRFTELAPFPEIHKPFEKGEKWKGYIKIGQGWGEWKGMTVKSYYEIIGQKDILTMMGDLTGCWQVEAKGESEVGVFSLDLYFHRKYGFVRMEYTKHNEERIILELVKVSGFNFIRER